MREMVSPPEGMWVCACGYQNVGAICTHCGAVPGRSATPDETLIEEMDRLHPEEMAQARAELGPPPATRRGPRQSGRSTSRSFDGVNRAGSGEVALWDWIVTGRWDRLHAPARWDDPDYEAMDEEAVTACGRRGWFSIPGLFTRMAAPRCAHCCRITGYPPGKGSPKNDDACRPLVEALLGGGHV